MARPKTKGDVQWHIPRRKRPIVYSTVAASNLIAALAEQGGTIRELQSRINYDQEAKDVLQAYIDHGYGDTDIREFKFQFL